MNMTVTTPETKDSGNRKDFTCIDSVGDIANIYLKGEIGDETCDPVIEFLINTSLSNPDEIRQVNFFIDSVGGDLDVAMKVIDAMRLADLKVRTIGWGRVASSALIILMNGDERLLSPRASILSHNATFTVSEFSTLVTDKSLPREFGLITERIMKIYMECSGKSEKYIRKYLLCDHDVYLSAEEAIQHGLADGFMPTGTTWMRIQSRYPRRFS